MNEAENTSTKLNGFGRAILDIEAQRTSATPDFEIGAQVAIGSSRKMWIVTGSSRTPNTSRHYTLRNGEQEAVAWERNLTRYFK